MFSAFLTQVQFNHINTENLQAVNQRAYDAELADYRTCLTRVNTRIELRGQFNGLYDLIEISVGPEALETKALINKAREQLDRSYPALDPNIECPAPAPPTAIKTG